MKQTGDSVSSRLLVPVNGKAMSCASVSNMFAKPLASGPSSIKAVGMKEGVSNMDIYALPYDSESDELDLLIDTKSPMPAESVPVGEGIYIRRDPASGRVVGAFIRGYSGLIKKVRAPGHVSDEAAKRLGVHEAFQAVLQWVRDQTRPDRTFQQVEKIVKILQESAKSPDDVRGIEGEMKRIITVLAHKRDSRMAQTLINSLITQKDFHRTNQTQQYFAAVQSALKDVCDLPPSEQAYRLGWACRLLKYEALKQERQQVNNHPQQRGGPQPGRPRRGGRQR
jgi:hypothetical protein